MDIIEKIFEIMKEKRISEYKVCKDCGLNQAQFYQWKKGKNKPSHDTIIKLANYFNVTTDFLLGQKENNNLITQSYAEQRIKSLIDEYDLSTLSDEQLEEFLTVAEITAKNIKKRN